MDKDKVREAVEYFKPGKAIGNSMMEMSNHVEHICVLRILAEQWLSVKMPEKIYASMTNFPANEATADWQEGFNFAIDQCTLAFTGKLLSKEEIAKILTDHYWDSLEKDRGIIEKHCEFLANAIIKAQQDK